jgi:hypothetical protein
MDEKKLKPCKANELFEGAVFWVKMDDGTLEKCVCALAWYPTEEMLTAYRAWIKKMSIEGRLFTRRDKPFQCFRDITHIKKM